MRSLARLFSSSRRAPPNAASKPCSVERLLQRLGLHHLGVQAGAGRERVDAARDAVLVDVHDELQPDRADRFVAEGDHLAEFPGRVDVQQRKWRRRGGEGLEGQMEHDAGVLADGVEHHRTLELGHDFADDVDGLGFKTA